MIDEPHETNTALTGGMAAFGSPCARSRALLRVTRRRQLFSLARCAIASSLVLGGCGASDLGPDGASAPGPGGGAQPNDSGASAPGTSAGVSLPDPGIGSPGGTNGTACAGISLAAENQRGPADIIFALDNSGSMDEEAVFVQENMNSFSEQIVGAAVDVRVVVISSYPGEGNGICIDAPLGSGACPDEDTALPTFLHVDEEVGSNDALELVVDTFPEYRSVLRPEAQKHVVVVTDDESDLAAADARDDILGLAPPMFDGFIFHGIFAFTEGDDDQCEGLAEEAGEEYRLLVAETGGVAGDLCLQDFRPVFDRLAQAVVTTARLACEWAIPAPPANAVFDPRMTNVRYSSSRQSDRSVGRITSASECQSAPDGQAWYYDDEVNPSRILLCPTACSIVQNDPGARVDIELGCPTIDILR